MQVPTGGIVRDPRKAAEPVTSCINGRENSGTDSIVWMREENILIGIFRIP